jgi:hypothetical protein
MNDSEHLAIFDLLTTVLRCVSHEQGGIWAGPETGHMDFKAMLSII